MTETRTKPAMLLVEDEEHCRVAMQRLLVSRGYKVEAVSSAEEALEVLKSSINGNSLGFLVVDVDLPGISGLDLLAVALREHPTLHAFVVSAADRTRVLRFAREYDICYLPKPLDVNRFFRAIRAYSPERVLHH